MSPALHAAVAALAAALDPADVPEATRLLRAAVSSGGGAGAPGLVNSISGAAAAGPLVSCSHHAEG